jgi:hypothetical protein
MNISWENIIYRLGLSTLFLLFGVQTLFYSFGEKKFYEIAQGLWGSSLVNYTVASSQEVPEQPKEQESVFDGFIKINQKYSLPESNQKFKIGKRIYLGAYFPTLYAGNFEMVLDHEEIIGHKMKFILFHKAWGDTDFEFPTDMVPYFKAMDITPVLTWEPWKRDFQDPTTPQPEYSLASINRGEHDGYIKSWAQEAKKSRVSIILRFAHEQSTPERFVYWYPWQGSSSEYVKAYRRIVYIFREEGASNVKFMWNPVAFWSGYEPSAYYPGDSFVDIVGLTVLNHGVKSHDPVSAWRTCDLVYSQQISRVNTYRKPIMIVEFGSSEEGGDKGEWFKDCLHRFDDNEYIIGVITLENPKDSSHDSVDWRTNTSNGSLGGFLSGINSGSYK